MGRMSGEEFVRRAREVHGDKYDYSKVEYVNSQVKVCIICPLHGEFMQRPNDHLHNKGCPNRECQKAKTIATNRAKYGVDYTGQAASVRAKINATNNERYGGNSPMCSSGVREKQQYTMVKEYGAAHALQCEQFLDKSHATVREHYGVDNVMQSDEVKAAFNKSCMARHGVAWPLASPEIYKKRADSFIKHHGVEYSFQSPVLRAKSVETHLRERGVGNPMQDVDVRLRQAARLMQNYGVSNPMYDEGVKLRVLESKIANGTFNVSQSEDALYVRLCGVFGEDDVVRQYYSDVYPYACDFYIRSRDMYVELNASWTHGGHWYDPASDVDLAVVSCFRERADEKDSDYYSNMLQVWMVSDPRKRSHAREGRLNYVVFWDTELRDAELWFAMGCPDGQDWDRAYSWLPERSITGMHVQNGLTGTPRNFSQVAKAYQFGEFYKRELALWDGNGSTHGIPLQVYLYHNRLKYLGKLPDQLSDAELMRAFTISGLVKGHTVFDVSLMDEVVRKYGIRSVFDPCAGWGERMLYCFYNDIHYQGVDVNVGLKPGYDHMIGDMHIRDQHIAYADSLLFFMDGNMDAVVTCPPYGSLEKYSEAGAENLSDDDFVEWWRGVVRNSLNVRPKYFCFQVNRKWRDRMVQAVVSEGFEVVDEFFYKNNRSSHFTRKGGKDVKRECESMVVLTRA